MSVAQFFQGMQWMRGRNIVLVWLRMSIYAASIFSLFRYLPAMLLVHAHAEDLEHGEDYWTVAWIQPRLLVGTSVSRALSERAFCLWPQRLLPWH